MTKTELRKRVSFLSALARHEFMAGVGAMVEVGVRNVDLFLEEPPDPDDEADWFAPEDDLKETILASQAVKLGYVAEGQVVHLYVSTWGDWGELQGVSMGWIGTAEHAPRLRGTDGPSGNVWRPPYQWERWPLPRRDPSWPG